MSKSVKRMIPSVFIILVSLALVTEDVSKYPSSSFAEFLVHAAMFVFGCYLFFSNWRNRTKEGQVLDGTGSAELSEMQERPDQDIYSRSGIMKRGMIPEQELDKELFRLKIIWVAILVSLPIYLYVGLNAGTDQHTSMNEDTFFKFRAILYIISFVTLFVTRYVRNLILSAKGQGILFKQTSQHPVLMKYSVSMIVALALSESIAIYGLVLFFLGKNAIDLYLLILVSAAAMLTYRPKKSEIISLAEMNQTDSASGGIIG